MKKTITGDEFVKGFTGSYEANFSREARYALFDYFAELEEASDTEMEFFPVDICCRWIEYTSLEEAIGDYGDEINTLEGLRENGEVIELPNGRCLVEGRN